MSTRRRLLALAGAPRPRVALSVGLGAVTVLCGVGLMATAGDLISRAAERPAVLSLTIAIVCVRLFGLTRPLSMVIRVAHPDHPDGVCYAKPQGISLEEVEEEDLVITDIPWGRILQGERATTVGHQMNREILRLRPDVLAWAVVPRIAPGLPAGPCIRRRAFGRGAFHRWTVGARCAGELEDLAL